MASCLHLEGHFGIWRQVDYGKLDPGARAEGVLSALSSSGLAYRRCELAWVNGDEIGVKFLTVGGGGKKSRGVAPKTV